MTNTEAITALKEALKTIDTVRPYMEDQTENNPEAINSVVYVTAVNEGEETVFSGAVFGDEASIVAGLVNAMEQQPALNVLFKAAITAYDAGLTCDCSACTERRRNAALNQMFNKSKN